MEEGSDMAEVSNDEPFFRRITPGNWIVIGMMLFSMIMAYSRLATKDEVATAIETVKKEYVSRESQTLQLQLVNAQVTALNSSIDEVKRDIKDIKRNLR